MQIYKIRLIRVIVVKLRAFILVKILRRLKLSNAKDAFGVTVKHNLKSLYQCNERVNLLIKPLVAIEKINKDSKVLIIGPRNENDLFMLNSHGVKMNNITGLDLISYSSKILLGDMHAMNFEDDYFDAVIFGWTLSYSSDPKKAIDEIIRVCKDGALVAVGVEYSGMTEKDSVGLLGYSIQEYDKLQDRINTTKQINNLFGERLKHVYFNHDAPLKRHHTKEGYVKDVSNVASIVEIKK